MSARKWTLSLICLSLLFTALSCGEAELDRTSDAGQIEVLIGDFSDAASSATSFKAMFADGKSPPESERKRYAQYTYRAKSDAQIDGDQATMRVAPRDLEDKEIAELDWQFTRVGEAWKITSAPLP